MGVENEAEQSIGRPCRQTSGGSKRPNELTSSIVPRGTPFHRSVELGYSTIAIDPARLSCRRDLPGPAELGAINPYAVARRSGLVTWENKKLLAAIKKCYLKARAMLPDDAELLR